MVTPSVITRFAPSPTGHLHIGGVRTALFCWAFARRHGGHFALRIEDTDQTRSTEESARGILEDLAWCGVHWDEGPVYDDPATGKRIGGDPRAVGSFYQSQRLPIYNQHIEQLIEMDKAYPAFDAAADLEAKRKAAVARKDTYRYDRAALNMPRAERMARYRAGEPHVVRFFMPDQPVHVVDEVLGEVKYAAGELDDFVIRKADGFPTYHFAVVVDDKTMGVTHIMRGQEHLNNTPRHVALQQAFGFPTPVYAHMPLIFNMDNTKMSKRDKAKFARAALKAAMEKDAALTVDAVCARTGDAPALIRDFLEKKTDDAHLAERLAGITRTALPEIEVEDFRRAGYMPDAITNFMALLGWSPGMKDAAGKDVEKFDNDFLSRHFSLERIGRTNARFDRVKLMSFNADRLGAMSDEQFGEAWRAWCLRYDRSVLTRFGVPDAGPLPQAFLWLARAVRPRTKVLSEAAAPVRFMLISDEAVAFDAQAVKKHLHDADGAGLRVLKDLLPRVREAAPFDPPAIHALLESFAAERGAGMGALAQPIRVALTGAAVSPGLPETLAVMGRESTTHRLERCIKVNALS